MNRTAFSLPEHKRIPDQRRPCDFARRRAVHRRCQAARRVDRAARPQARRRAVVGNDVPGRYESFDMGFADPPLRLEATGVNF